MQLYQHEFETVEQYLHHRAPYLLVDKILSISSDKIVTQKSVTDDDFFMAGHFPGAPIFPGAMMQELTTQSAGILIAARYNPMKDFNTEDPFHNEFALGVLVKVNRARYKGFARPGDTLIATVRLNERLAQVFDFSADIAIDDKIVMRISFQLANIKSKQLQGV
jgi:3-hydroxyacyl-[acyl-carrier-protein] dehydratase